MVRTSLTHLWTDTVNELLARGTGYFDNLDAIEVTTEFHGPAPSWAILGQYDSWRPAILLQEAHLGDKTHTVLHELGHHLHYFKMYGDPRDVGDTRDEWSEWFHTEGIEQNNLEDGYDAEFVADVFADWHQGKITTVPSRYEYLDGPELGEPIATDL